VTCPHTFFGLLVARDCLFRGPSGHKSPARAQDRRENARGKEARSLETSLGNAETRTRRHSTRGAGGGGARRARGRQRCATRLSLCSDRSTLQAPQGTAVGRWHSHPPRRSRRPRFQSSTGTLPRLRWARRPAAETREGKRKALAGCCGPRETSCTVTGCLRSRSAPLTAIMSGASSPSFISLSISVALGHEPG
jgi:hypothetical protein